MSKNLVFVIKVFTAFALYTLIGWLTYLTLGFLLSDVVKIVQLSWYGLCVESGLLTLFMLFIYVIFRRLKTAFFISGIFYVAFIVASYIKIKMLDTPIYPADLAIIGDLLRTWSVMVEYLPYMIIFLVLSFLIIRFLFKKESPDSKAHFNLFFSMTILALSCVATIRYKEPIREGLKSVGIFDKKSANLTKRGLKNGLLTSFTQVLLFPAKAPEPEGYSEKSVQSIIGKYGLNQPTKAKQDQAQHVIILMIEAFSDPEYFGWELTRPAIPNFLQAAKNHSNGMVMSPVFGGRSVNAEFEFMTGFTNRFIPNQTNPYHEFVSQDITGLPRAFKNNGFKTHAIQAVFFEGFGYEKVYDYIGVEQKISMTTEVNGYKPDPSGRSIDSAEIANQIIRLTQEHDKNFIFSFPNSTHMPWVLSHYPETDLLLKSQDNYTNSSYKTISAYGNALLHMDQMIGQLIDYYNTSDDKTMLVVFGDHQPGIARFRSNESRHTGYSPLINDRLDKYQTPLLIWTNYSTTINNNLSTSLNLLPGLIIDKAGIPAQGLMKFNIILNSYYQLFSDIIKQNGVISIESQANTEQLYSDYQMLQYDALFGKNYLYNIITTQLAN